MSTGRPRPPGLDETSLSDRVSQTAAGGLGLVDRSSEEVPVPVQHLSHKP